MKTTDNNIEKHKLDPRGTEIALMFRKKMRSVEEECARIEREAKGRIRSLQQGAQPELYLLYLELLKGLGIGRDEADRLWHLQAVNIHTFFAEVDGDAFVVIDREKGPETVADAVFPVPPGFNSGDKGGGGSGPPIM